VAKIKKRTFKKDREYTLRGIRGSDMALPRTKGGEARRSLRNTPGYGKAILVTISDKPENQMTGFEKMNLVDEGVSKLDLENLKKSSGLDYKKLAEVLSVARATLINKKGKAKFNSALSEKIIGLADVYSYGYDVFEDKDKFNQWILSPNKALGGKKPFDLLNNTFGRQEIKHLIGRIDQGVYS